MLANKHSKQRMNKEIGTQLGHDKQKKHASAHTYLLRHIIKADVEGSVAFGFVCEYHIDAAGAGWGGGLEPAFSL
jgi:hypothetical protein